MTSTAGTPSSPWPPSPTEARRAATSEWWIAAGAVPNSPGSPAAPTYQVLVHGAGNQRPDVFWNETANRLYVLFSGSGFNTVFYEFQPRPAVSTRWCRVPTQSPG